MPIEFGPIRVGGKEPQIDSEAIAQIESGVRSITAEIKRDGRHYDLIIADDTSGRIPTLIVGKTLNRLNGAQPAALRFVGKLGRSQEVETILGRLGFMPERALLVTEYIASGLTIRKFGSILSNKGINFDVAALYSLAGRSRFGSEYGMPPDTSVYVGEVSKVSPEIYHRHDLTGLKGDEGIKRRVWKRSEMRESVRKARKDVAVLEPISKPYPSRS